MPLYEYTCTTCGKIFEKMVPFNGNPAKVYCPSGHKNVRRIYSTPAITFKGSGWYITEHRKDKSSSGERRD